ncbi:hypothetical protein PP175_27720 (plasmid) [Aneurinibacillus sp. Ricciae_BoGa-3]|uniref:hypothetical protein n=1 Tax=Aneurinibacillus sp. Ricciae_BoGa-3 TaxID=3022697 RepID=UPI002341EB74|nr:hypothetical protein [Aneurinibacillus sp. Ricciae_BoGa-3]WCK56982.1 hypothetical protein PP175_27720 [Aneurinibacillus sp. Ricciae_BoGa-3]
MKKTVIALALGAVMTSAVTPAFAKGTQQTVQMVSPQSTPQVAEQTRTSSQKSLQNQSFSHKAKSQNQLTQKIKKLADASEKKHKQKKQAVKSQQDVQAHTRLLNVAKQLGISSTGLSDKQLHKNIITKLKSLFKEISPGVGVDEKTATGDSLTVNTSTDATTTTSGAELTTVSTDETTSVDGALTNTTSQS